MNWEEECRALRQEVRELRAALETAAQKFIELAPKDGETDAAPFFQAAIDIRALTAAE